MKRFLGVWWRKEEPSPYQSLTSPPPEPTFRDARSRNLHFEIETARRELAYMAERLADGYSVEWTERHMQTRCRLALPAMKDTLIAVGVLLAYLRERV